MKQMIKTLIAGFIALAMVFTLTPMVGGYAFAENDDEGEGESLELEKIVFDGDAEYDWAHFYTVDDPDTELSIEDLNISVLDQNDEVVDPDEYSLKIVRTWYDENTGQTVTERVDGSVGIYTADKRENGGSGFTEYSAIVKPKKGSDYDGYLDASFYVMDKYSLNWICMNGDFSPLHKMENLGMHDYWKGAFAKLPVSPVIRGCDGTELIEGTDYELEYYYRPNDYEFTTYNPVQDENDNPCRPTEPGSYYVKVKGIGSYYGESDVAIDLTEYEPIFIDADNGWDLWSDGTAHFTVTMPEIDGGEPILEVAMPGGGDEDVVFSEKDGDYSFDEDTGELILDGSSIFEHAGNPNGFSISIYAYIMVGETMPVSETAWVNARKATIDNGIEQHEDFQDREMLPREGGYISREYSCNVYNADNPEGREYSLTVTDVEVVSQKPEVAGEDVVVVERVGDEDAWDFASYETKNPGLATVQITYESEMDGEEHTYDFTIHVVETLVDANMWSVSGIYQGLPGDEITLKASGKKRSFIQDEEDPDNYEYVETEEGIDFDWSIVDEGSDYATVTPNDDEAVLKFADAEDMPASWDGERIEIEVKVVASAGDNNQYQAEADNRFWLSNEFYQIEPAEIDPNLDVSKSVTIDPIVKYYQVGEQPEVVDANITWDGVNTYDVSIDRDDETGKLTITRHGQWEINYCLRANDVNDPNKLLTEQWYHFNQKNYRMQFKSTPEYNEGDIVFDDGTITYTLETKNLPEDAEIAYTILRGNEEELPDSCYTLDEEEQTITLDGEKLVDNGIKWVKLKAEASLDGTVICRTYGEDFEEEWRICEVEKATNEIRMDDFDILPGERDYVNGNNWLRIRNTEFPYGTDIYYEVTNVEVTNGAEFILDEYLDQSGGKTYLKKVVDEDGSNYFSYDYEIKSLTELEELGDIVFNVSYILKNIDANGDEVEVPKSIPETGSFNYIVHVTKDVYGVEISSEDGSWKALPGKSITLIAEGWHDYLEVDDTTGEVIEKHTGEDLDYVWSLDCDEDIATITPDAADPAKAVVTFKNKPDELIEEYDYYQKDVEVRVKMYDGTDKVAEDSRDLYVSDWYYQIDPQKLEGNLNPGKTICVTPQLLFYSLDENGDEVYEPVTDDNLTFRWDDYDEDVLKVTGPDENGAYTIERLSNGETDLRIVAEWDDEAEEDVSYWFDRNEYEMEFTKREYKVAPDGQIVAELDTSKLGDWNYELEFEAGYFEDGDEVWHAASESIYAVNGNKVTIFGDKLQEEEPDGVNIHAKLMYGDEFIEDAWCWVELGEEDPCEHEMTPHEAVEPTCGEAGNSAYWSCSKCGKFFADENGEQKIDEGEWIIEATGRHTWNDGEVTEQPTCNGFGKMTYECSVCHQKKTEPIAINPDAHDWDEIKYEWAEDFSTVTATKACKRNAEHNITETVPATGVVTEAATCSATGLKTYTSNDFEYEEFEVQTTTEVIGKLSHTWDDGLVTREPTCQVEGEMTYECTVCHEKKKEPIEIDLDDPNVHDWDDGVETNAPDCGNAGIMTFTCKDCGKTRAEAIPATGNHTWGEAVKEIITPATCTSAGSYDEVIYCEVCGAEHSREAKEEPALGHDKPLAHAEAKEPTCEEDGNYENWYCSKCKKHFADANAEEQYAEGTWIKPATGHSWDDGTVTTPATCTKAGSKTFKCKVCEKTMTTAIAAVGHQTTHVKNAAGLLKDGSEYDECSVCKEKLNYIVLPGYSTYYVKAPKLASGKKSFTIKWKKQTKKNLKKFNGYQIRYSLKKNMAKAKMVKVKKTATSKTIKKLKSKKKYYVQIRTFTKKAGKIYYSKWSPKKVVKIK